MPRPSFITEQDIIRWDANMQNDPNISKSLLNSDTIKEVCYAGFYLGEELDKLNCPAELIVRIQFTAGTLSFGRDPWDISMDMLEKYKNNELNFEENPDTIKN